MVVKMEVIVRGADRLAEIISTNRLYNKIDRFLDRGAELVRQEAEALAPVRTGRLAASIQKTRIGAMHYVVGSPLSYAVFQEVGTRPHMIYPRNARALRFEIGGAEVFAKYVQHPGFEGRRYFARAVAVFRSEWRGIFEEVMRE